MTELGDREEELMSLPTRDLAVRFRDLPTTGEAPDWPDMDELTEEALIRLSDWVEEQIPEVINNRVRPEVVEMVISEEVTDLVGRAHSGCEWVEYTSVFMRGKVWMAEVMYWKGLILNDGANAEGYFLNLRDSLNLASRLFMVSGILVNRRLMETSRVVKTNLKVLGMDDISKEIAERDAEMFGASPGEHGKSKPYLN